MPIHALVAVGGKTCRRQLKSPWCKSRCYNPNRQGFSIGLTGLFSIRNSQFVIHIIMQLTFLGTGTSMGVPVVACTCSVCTSGDPYNQRMRTSALLEAGGLRILIDAGPDFRMQALRIGLDRLDAVILTHSHYDHVAGIDDLRPLNRCTRNIPIYGNPETLRDVRERFNYAFAATSNGSSRPALNLVPIASTFTIGPLTFTSFEVPHGVGRVTGYRIGNLGYVTDASGIPDAVREQLRDLDLLVLNALREEPHPTHFSLNEAVAMVAILNPKRARFVHMTHDLDHQTINARLPASIALAHDGLVLEVAD